MLDLKSQNNAFFGALMRKKYSCQPFQCVFESEAPACLQVEVPKVMNLLQQRFSKDDNPHPQPGNELHPLTFHQTAFS